MTADQLDGCPEQYRNVKRKTPVVDVPKVIFDTLFDRGRGGSRSSAAVYLRPSGQSWFDATPECVVSHDLVEFVIVGHRVRTRSHQRHAAVQHVEQLG